MKYNFLRPKYNLKLKRLGSLSDGGYLVPKEVIDKVETLLSFGLNDDWAFESDFKKVNPKIRVITYDHTVNRKFWYEYTILAFFHFLKSFKNFSKIYKFINYYSFFSQNKNNFHYKKKIVKKKYLKNEISIDEISHQIKSKLFIKIDIENDEYRILESLKNFKTVLGFVIEFHNVDLNFKLIKNFLKKNKNFKVVHTHPNNMGSKDSQGHPTVIEVTFINKLFCKNYKLNKSKKFKKHIFDYPNDPKRNDISIS